MLRVDNELIGIDILQVIAPSPGIGKIMAGTLNYAKPIANAAVFNDWNKVTPVNGSDTTGFRNYVRNGESPQ